MDQYLLMMGFSMINGILWDIYIYGYGSIPINTIFNGMNIHESQLF